MSDQPLVAVVVLNWKQRELTLECLKSVSGLEYPEDKLQVIVVDNASKDGSVETLREVFPKVAVIENEFNLGYTGGNNVGIRRALHHKCEYILLLNNDVLVESNALSRLLEYAKTKPQCAFLGPLIKIREEPQKILSAGGRLVNGWRAVHLGEEENTVEGFYQERDVDFLSGCALLIRMAVLDKIGLLDERYYLYHEDVEWCARARKSGYSVQIVPRAIVWHPDTHIRDDNSDFVTYYQARNNLLFVHEYFCFYTLVKAVFSYSRILLSWTIKPKWKYKKKQRLALFWAIVDFLKGKYGPRAATNA